jgi:hypothetical protein
VISEFPWEVLLVGGKKSLIGGTVDAVVFVEIGREVD